MLYVKLLIIRHGDPNYAIDGLTEKGEREVQLLADRLCREEITAVYCSTLGRAKLTAAPTLERLGITAEYCEWLREFNYVGVNVPYPRNSQLPWDILPEYMNEHPLLYSPTEWKNDSTISPELLVAYDEVCAEFDAVLAKHGYRRRETQYTVEHANHDTLVFVCHFGLSCVLLSHLLNCSPYTLWQHTCLPPTSVTTFNTEERVEGIASFRGSGLGDISHLYVADEPAAFSARFCECFTDETRH